MENRIRRLVALPWVVPGIVLLFAQWEVWLGGLTHQSGPLVVTAVSGGSAAVLLSWRRVRPLIVQVAAAVVMVSPWLVWGAPESGAGFVVGIVATYAVGRWSPGASSYLALPVVTAWILSQIALDPLGSSIADGWGWTLWGLTAWGAGRWMRQQAEIGARRAAEHDVRARALLTEQRLDIARDVHDLLASSLGVIVVHAEAAEELVCSDPDRAAQAMRRVQVTGRDGLTQLRALLGPLRDGSGGPERGLAAQSPVDPHDGQRQQPGLEDAEALIEQLRAAGLPVTYERRGDNKVPAELGRVVYRLLQEALTNVVRHAGLVTTSAVVVVDDHALTVEVNDAGQPGRGTPLSGHVHLGNGLRGMQERLEPFGGTLDVSHRPGGGLRVHSVVPTHRSRPYQRWPVRRSSSAPTLAP